MLTARQIFDSVIECTQAYRAKYELNAAEMYLTNDAKIVLSKAFETGVTKIQKEIVGTLTGVEVDAMASFKKPPRVVVNVEVETKASASPDDVYYNTFAKKRKLDLEAAAEASRQQGPGYKSTAHVVPTTCHVERLFSQCKLYLNSKRRRLLAANLDVSLFLREHMDKWDALDVQEVLTGVPATEDGAYSSDSDSDD